MDGRLKVDTTRHCSTIHFVQDCDVHIHGNPAPIVTPPPPPVWAGRFLQKPSASADLVPPRLGGRPALDFSVTASESQLSLSEPELAGAGAAALEHRILRALRRLEGSRQ